MSDWKILRWGVTADMDDEFRRVTILSNLVYLMVFTIVLTYQLFNLPHLLTTDASSSIVWLIPMGLLAASSVGLTLNFFGKRILSKLLFLVSWIFLSTMLAPITRGTTEASYVSIGMFTVISTVMVHILFSWRRETTPYIVSVVVTWLLLIFFVDFLDLFRIPGDENLLFLKGFPRWRFLVAMLALFFNGAVIYTIKLNNQLTDSLVRRNLTIEQQNHQLAEQRERLVALAMQLREKVDDSSAQLSEQYTKLTEYSYFNSHILRAPVSRIRGLLHLLSLNVDTQEEAEVRRLLGKSMEELDEAIKGITDKLNEAAEHRSVGERWGGLPR